MNGKFGHQSPEQQRQQKQEKESYEVFSLILFPPKCPQHVMKLMSNSSVFRQLINPVKSLDIWNCISQDSQNSFFVISIGFDCVDPRHVNVAEKLIELRLVVAI
jgi:hypothetical protein